MYPLSLKPLRHTKPISKVLASAGSTNRVVSLRRPEDDYFPFLVINPLIRARACAEARFTDKVKS